MQQTQVLNILLVEDDRIETMKFDRVTANLDIDLSIQYADNGEKAMSMLEDADGTLPDLILLDLNMPLFNGKEFLAYIKATDHLKYIPVVILTTSENTKDLKACYDIGIAGYIVKPLAYESYEVAIQRIVEYWSINRFFVN